MNSLLRRRGRYRRLAPLAGVVIAGCTDAGADAPRLPAHQYVIGVDISGSRTPTQLQEAGRLINGMIGRMQNGDRLVLVETYRANNDAARQFDDSIPPARRPDKPTGSDRKKVAYFQNSARIIAQGFVDPKRSKTIMSTDLLMTLQRAADYARSGGGRSTTLLLLSDMLNSTPELNMERAGGIPDSAWIAKLQVQGRMPDLRGVCVFAVGGDVRTSRGAAARRFWKAYLAAAGATYSDERNYRNMVADAAEVGCAS